MKRPEPSAGRFAANHQGLLNHHPNTGPSSRREEGRRKQSQGGRERRDQVDGESRTLRSIGQPGNYLTKHCAVRHHVSIVHSLVMQGLHIY